MKYARKFAREQDKKYLPQAVRQNNHELTISVMAGVLAMCFTLSPVGEASTYSRADGGPAVIKTGNTAEIYAGKLINGNASLSLLIILTNLLFPMGILPICTLVPAQALR
jgi:hypothetical protein